MPATSAPPTVAELAAFLKLPDTTPGLGSVLAVALSTQAAECVTDPYTVDLHTAALRRAHREYASRPFPLGTMDVSEWGVARVGNDRLIGELERDYRKPGFR